MTQARSSVYRGETRELAEAAYHADARAMARMGYAPTAEDWSSVVEVVLTVQYVHAPELQAAVLEAVAMAEAERAPARRPARAPALRKLAGPIRGFGADLFDRLPTELKVTLGAIVGLAAGISAWSVVGVALFGHNPFVLFVSLFTLGFAGGLVGALATLRWEVHRTDGGI